VHVNNPVSHPIRRTGRRRRARELALQIFYAMEISGQEAQESIQRIRECFNYPESAWEYALPLVLGVEKHREELDRMIQQSSEHWSLYRMACVDRNLLRLAVYELMFCPDIPKKVALNEAVDLGKKFGAEDTGAFVNGVLDRVASLLEK